MSVQPHLAPANSSERAGANVVRSAIMAADNSLPPLRAISEEISRETFARIAHQWQADPHSEADSASELTYFGRPHPDNFPGGERTLIGRGRALTLSVATPAEASRQWRELTGCAQITDPISRPGSGLLAFGSLPFFSDSPASGTLIIPREILGTDDAGCFHTRIEGGANSPATSGDGQDRASAEGDSAVGHIGRTQWIHAVQVARDYLRAGRAEKVVLARPERIALPLGRAAAISAVIGQLRQANPSSWIFAIDGLCGATPELLARLRGEQLFSRVLAGTADNSPSGHARLAGSAKDRREHALAVNSVTGRLGHLCSQIDAPAAPAILELPTVIHFASDITAELRRGGEPISALEVVGAIHPTAAVGGTPREVAMDIIRELEPVERARYAGPVGWIDYRGDGEWGIALRCAHFLPDGAAAVAELWAGAGIMSDSDPEVEWEETTAKMAPMRSVCQALQAER